MTIFNYKARNENGTLIEGELEAASVEAAALELSQKHYIPVSINSKKFSLDLLFFISDFHSIRSRDLSVFFKQLSTIFAAGVPLVETLGAVSEQITDKKFQRVVERIKTDIESGSSFSQALSKHPRVFSHLIVAMAAAGEKGGMLSEVLNRISIYLEKEGQFQQKIKGALRYPALVLSVLGIAFIVAVTTIIPRFIGVFTSTGKALPLPTQILLWLNSAITNYWLLVIIGIAALIFLIRYIISTPIGRRQMDTFLLRAPVLGMLNTKLGLSRFFTMLSSMLSSGIPMVYALSVTADTADNTILSGMINDIHDQIINGSSLSRAMKKFNFFPTTSVHMAAIGEKSGNITEMLTKTAEYFDEETDYVISNLMVLLEPLLIFFLAMLVTLLALGIFLPIWDLNSVVISS